MVDLRKFFLVQISNYKQCLGDFEAFLGMEEGFWL